MSVTDLTTRVIELTRRLGDLGDQAENGCDHGLRSALDSLRQRLDGLLAQRGLSRHEELLRVVAGNMPMMISYVDRGGRYRFVNREHEVRSGMSQDQILGRPLREVVGEKTWAVLRERVEAALAGEQVSFEASVPLSEQDAAWVGVTYVPDLDERGAVQGFYAFVTDVSDRRRTREALSASEATLRSILASTLDPVVVIDAFGTVQSVSDSIQRVLGWKPDQLVGRSISLIMPEPHRSKHDTYLGDYRRTGVTNILGRAREFEALRPDGGLVPIELAVSRVDLPGKNPLLTGILRDVTERKRTDEQLRLIHSLAFAIGEARDLEAAMRVTLEHICAATRWESGEAWLPEDDGCTLQETPVWHAADARLDLFQAMSRGTRLAPGEGLVGRVWASRRPEWLDDLTRPELFKRAEAAGHAGLRVGLAIPILADDEVVAVLAFFMTERRPEDRRQIDLVATAAAPLGPLIQRKRIEAALAESERRLREMLTSVELAAVGLDRAGSITFCNDFLLRLTGWRREEVLGRNWFEHFAPIDERQRISAVFRGAIEHGRVPSHYEHPIVTRSGERRLIAWSNTVLRDTHGTIVGANSLGVDITEQRHTEEELARHREHLEHLVQERTAELEATHQQLRLADRLASIGTLVAGLGHDMNNVLFPVRSRLDVIEALTLPPRAREHLAAIRHSVEYLQQLTDGLHLLALDPEDTRATEGETDLPAWWQRAEPLLRKLVPPTATFEGAFPDDLPVAAVAPHGLTQAVLNLVVNAGEVIGNGGHVWIAARTDDDRSTVRISVADDGGGMSPEVRRRALDPFFTTKKRGLGTGLGLSLVHGVAKSAGGTVQIESEPGRGTTVTLLLPARDRGGSAAGAGEQDRVAVISLRDGRIASLLETLLRRAGFEVDREGPGDPARAALWLVEPASASTAQVRAFLRAPHRQVIVCGAEPEGWADLGVIVVRDGTDFQDLREQVRRALLAVSGETP